MKKQFLFFLFCLCAGVSNVWAQETDWSPLFTRVSEGITYTCENDETYPWELVDGSLVSTNKAQGSSSTFTVTITCSNMVKFTMVSFTSSESPDKIIIKLDGETRVEYGGEMTTWSSHYFVLTPGEHKMQVSYKKDGSVDRGQDLAKIGGIRLIDWEKVVTEIELSAPGQLGEEVVAAVGTLPQMESMRLKGTLNAEDWKTMKNLTGLEYLDMTETTVTEIPAEAFTNNRIRVIKWPANLKVIGGKAFYNKYLMGHLVLPETLDSIGPSAFY